MLKIPFPSLYISNFSEEDAPRTPRPPRTLPNKPASPARVFKPLPTPQLLKLRSAVLVSIATRCSRKKKRSKGGSFENEALENEDRSTKLPKLETTVG